MTGKVTGTMITSITSEDVAAAELRRVSADLAACGSIEMGAHRPEDAVRIAELLPSGTRVYVNHLPRHSLDDTLRGLLAVQRAGLEPVPHIAARRVGSHAELQRFLRRAVDEAGVTKALVLGGDLDKPEGPFADAAQLLRDGGLKQAGIAEIGLAGYPEGHPRIASSVLASALQEKLGLARTLGLGAWVVSTETDADITEGGDGRESTRPH